MSVVPISHERCEDPRVIFPDARTGIELNPLTLPPRSWFPLLPCVGWWNGCPRQALGGTLNNVLFGSITGVEFDRSLINNAELLDRVGDSNEAQNGQGPSGRTFLMPQVMRQ